MDTVLYDLLAVLKICNANFLTSHFPTLNGTKLWNQSHGTKLNATCLWRPHPLVTRSKSGETSFGKVRTRFFELQIRPDSFRCKEALIYFCWLQVFPLTTTTSCSINMPVLFRICYALKCYNNAVKLRKKITLNLWHVVICLCRTYLPMILPYDNSWLL